MKEQRISQLNITETSDPSRSKNSWFTRRRQIKSAYVFVNCIICWCRKAADLTVNLFHRSFCLNWSIKNPQNLPTDIRLHICLLTALDSFCKSCKTTFCRAAHSQLVWKQPVFVSSFPKPHSVYMLMVYTVTSDMFKLVSFIHSKCVVLHPFIKIHTTIKITMVLGCIENKYLVNS